MEPRRRAEQARLAVVQQAYVPGVSTRKVDEPLQALGLTGIDKSAVSRLCRELDPLVEPFRQRPLAAASPDVWLDAPYPKVRQNHRIKVRQNHRVVSQAVVIAVGVRETGEREVLPLRGGRRAGGRRSGATSCAACSGAACSGAACAGSNSS